MISIIAFDSILRLISVGMMRESLIVKISNMDLYYPTADVAGLGIPHHMVTDFEALSHLRFFQPAVGLRPAFCRPERDRSQICSLPIWIS